MHLWLPATTLPLASFRSRALVLRVTEGAATLQYIARLNQRTPLVAIHLHLPPRPLPLQPVILASSTACGDCSGGPLPGCNTNTCVLFPSNTVTEVSTGGEVAQDALSLLSNNGSKPSWPATAPNLVFSCAPTFRPRRRRHQHDRSRPQQRQAPSPARRRVQLQEEVHRLILLLRRIPRRRLLRRQTVRPPPEPRRPPVSHLHQAHH